MTIEEDIKIKIKESKNKSERLQYIKDLAGYVEEQRWEIMRDLYEVHRYMGDDE